MGITGGGVTEYDLILVSITLSSSIIVYIKSILEQSCVVWHSSLTQEDTESIERVQKNALRVILRSNFQNYENAFEKLNLETLEERREKLCLSFAKKCQRIPQANELFKEKN